MVRLLNRAACRYLVRGNHPTPIIAAPGPDLGATTDWVLTNAGSSDEFLLSSPVRPDMYLQIKDGELFYGERAHDLVDPDGWRIKPVGDGSEYLYIVSARSSGYGLRLAERADRGDIHADVGPIGTGHDTMWFLNDRCVRDARSIHLRYPSSVEASLFYNEVAPYDTPVGTYFCATGFGENNRGRGPCGYAGIQRRGDGSRIAIFSVWHRMLDEKTPNAGGLAVTIDASPEAERTLFAGEGKGQSIRIPFSWDPASPEPIRFAVSAHKEGADTVLAAYVGAHDRSWTYMGSIKRVATNGRLLAGLYSFIEDFNRNGDEEGIPADQRSPYLERRAVFSNPWIGNPANNGRLEPVTSAKVTAYGPHPLENLSVVAWEPNSFGLLVGSGLRTSADPSILGSTFKDSTPSRRRRPGLPEDE